MWSLKVDYLSVALAFICSHNFFKIVIIPITVDYRSLVHCVYVAVRRVSESDSIYFSLTKLLRGPRPTHKITT